MTPLDLLDKVYIVWAFTFQILLIIHFALRKWNFEKYTFKYGWIIYALGLFAAALSVVQLLNNKAWYFWLAGLLYLVWAVFGIMVEYVKKIRWRNPIRPRILAPYVTLYLGTIMFYWWPLGLLSRPAWYVYAVLFVLITVLNLISHH